ncbi:glycosyltransferase family 4 protein [uncultured Fusobacterium sp.]|uniref:glycosyltransferase family 4 protein n=1 Tax=uncultured Fusobacterium sp. TaxID=159267 RepID=UPI0025E5ECCD|nr:glycosyltransferase family 4 protein [uncultured Fusobacterium sp.]
MKKVIFLRSNPVNPDSRVEKEVFTLKKNGYEIEILGWDRSKNYRLREEIVEQDKFNINIYRIGIKASYSGGIKKNLMPLIRFQISIFYFLFKKRKEIEVIHACDFDTGFISLIFSKIFKKKLIYDIFDYYVDSFNVPNKIKKIIQKIDGFVIKNADSIILCSEKRRDQFRGVVPKKEVIIHNTPNYLNKFKVFDNMKKSKNIKIVYVGVLLKKERMLEELLEIVSKNSDYELHIGGFGELEEYVEKMANKYSNIIFYGKIPYLEALELESNCDIMVALYDPKKRNHLYAAPNKFYEALMLGKPIIMVKNTGMSEIISKYDIGEVIDFTKEALEEGLKKISDKKDKWKIISNIQKNLYTKYYSWNEMERRLLNLYKEIY